MKITDLFEKASYEEKQEAEAEFIKAWSTIDTHDDPIKPEVITTMKAAVKVLGRAYKIYTGKGYTLQGTAGNILDRFEQRFKEQQTKLTGAKMPFPTGKEASAVAFKSALSSYFHGYKQIARSLYGRVWTTGSGYRHKDPSEAIEFFIEDEFDDAWEEIQKHGKIVYVTKPLSSNPTKMVQLGKYLIYPGTTVRGAFSAKPESDYYIYIQTTAILKNALIKKMEISDQEAAHLNDLAATKNDAAIRGIKAIIDAFKSKEDAEKAIASSKQLTAKTKNILQGIVDGAKDFKET